MLPPVYSKGSNFTIGNQEFGLWHLVEVTDPLDITLDPAYEGAWVGIWNSGDSIATIKDAGGTLGTIGPAQGSHIVSRIASGAADWPSKILVVGANGTLYVEGGVVIRSGALYLPDTTDGNFIEVVATADALVVTDTGASEPGGGP